MNFIPILIAQTGTSTSTSSSPTLAALVLQWAPLVASAVVLLGAILTFRANQNAIWQRTNDADIKDIQQKLDGFYGPLMHRLNADHLLAQDLRARQPDPSAYRLLTSLFDENWRGGLSIADSAIVREICEHARKLEQFIYEHAGLVDGQVSPYMVRATTHFRVLALAYDGELGTDAERFAR